MCKYHPVVSTCVTQVSVRHLNEFYVFMEVMKQQNKEWNI